MVPNRSLLDTYLRTRVRFVFADGGFAGRLLDWATHILCTTIHIVRKPADQRGFAVITPLGGRMDPRLADRTPPPGPRLRTRPGHVRGHDPLCGDQHHHSPYRPRRPGHPTATAHLPSNKIILKAPA